VIASWDGVTYLVDDRKNVSLVNMRERIAAFRAGAYSISPTRTETCFFYVTFNDTIIMYYNVSLNSIAARTMLNSL
jgi:Integrin-alpha FG-GAP repeat-containing protein 2